MFTRLSRRFRAKPAAAGTPVRTLPSLEAYAQWAQAYAPYAHNPLMQAEQAAVTQALLAISLKGKTALDLACGTGRYTHWLRAHGARRVISVDNSAAMLRAGQSHAPGLPLAAQAAMDALPLIAGCVDVVVCGLAVGHLPSLDGVFRMVAHVLTSGGVAIISDFHPFLFLTQRKRTFTVDRRTFAVEHYPHLYADIHRTAQENALSVEQVLEPRLEIDGHRLPAVLVYRLEKRA